MGVVVEGWWDGVGVVGWCWGDVGVEVVVVVGW